MKWVFMAAAAVSILAVGLVIFLFYNECLPLLGRHNGFSSPENMEARK